MSITTLDQVAAGARALNLFNKAATPTLVAGRAHSLAYLSGMPGAATAPSPGLTGEALTSWAGQLPFENPASGYAYRAKLSAMSSGAAGLLLLCDRLWQNSGITITSTGSQSINSVTFPARDNNESSNGAGILVGVEVSTATGAGTPTLTLGYTNSAGDTGRSATNLFVTASSSAIGAFYLFGLQAGDVGVRSIQTYQQSATWTSGTIHLVAFRILDVLEIGAANSPASTDCVSGGLPKVFSNTCPFLVFIPSATTASFMNGSLLWTHG